MAENLTAKASITIAASVEKVWTALIDPEAIRQYLFGTQVECAWTEGAPIFWRGEWQGKAYEDKGVILEMRPAQRLRYTHFSPLSGLPDIPENHHTVRVELKADGGQTHVFLEQDKNPDEKSRLHSEKNWEMVLAGLKKVVEGSADRG